ncbi:MAG: hypothetical protein PHY93_11020 [Bacteriovorax sp.]|nr:hypothetical protein [Bacteriovorax sp.]
MNWFDKIKNREIDGRWFLGGSHITLVIICLLFFSLQRTPIQIAFAILCGLITEYIFYQATSKYEKYMLWDRLFSAFTEVAGLLVLLKSHLWWFYGFLGAVTVAAKYLFRKTEKTHIFNPTNFAITIAVTFFPLHWFGAWPDEYMSSWYPMLHITAFGIIAVWLGRIYIVSIAYILSVIFWCLVFFPINGLASLIYAIGPEFGAIGLIYLWLMITDPKTAPKKYKHQIFYGFSIAFIHILLRYNQYIYSRFVALFIVTLLYYALTLFNETNRSDNIA